jgi:hypothetical protein
MILTRIKVTPMTKYQGKQTRFSKDGMSQKPPAEESRLAQSVRASVSSLSDKLKSTADKLKGLEVPFLATIKDRIPWKPRATGKKGLFGSGGRTKRYACFPICGALPPRLSAFSPA